MANSDKNILITPNVGAATGTNPTIRFTGADNTPITLRVLDNGTVSFEGTAGQLFSVADGMTGTIFSVNDISGIPSIEVLDTGLVKLNQYNGQTAIGTSAALTSGSVASMLSVVSRTATTPALILKGATSQTANVQEWQSSAGLVGFFKVNGSLNARYFDSITALGTYLDNAVVTNSLAIIGRATNAVTLIIRPVGSQTSDLIQYQDSAGTAITGGITAAGFAYFGTTHVGGTMGIFPLAANRGLVIRANTSQSVDLQQWQNTSATPITWVDQNAVLNTSNTPTSNNQVANKLYVDNAIAASVTTTEEIIPLDDISNYFDGTETRFVPRYQGDLVTITNPFRLLLTINGIIQYVNTPEYVWMSGLPQRGFFVDSDGQLQFSEAVPAGSEFDARIMSGNATTTRTRVYPFKPLDILLGG